jgi:hypothetical protein
MNYKAPDNSIHFIEPEFDYLLPAGSIAITEEEAETLRPKPSEPSPIDQIRALEQQYADAQAKMTRQALLVIALDKACADPTAAGLTRDEVHTVLMSGDNGYRALYLLEQQVSALRKQL